MCDCWDHWKTQKLYIFQFFIIFLGDMMSKLNREEEEAKNQQKRSNLILFWSFFERELSKNKMVISF